MIAILLTSSLLSAQGLTIGSGTTFSLGSATFSLPGNWSNGGTFNANNGTVIFNGTTTQTIANPSGETFGNLTVNKSAGDVQLANNITVNGNLTLTSGDLDVNGKTISLGSSALVSETAGNTVKGNGNISGTTALNAPSSVNPFGLGATITSAENLGSTTITRGSTAQMGNGNFGIKRYYDITPANDNALNATLVFHYDTSELNGLNESTLRIFRSTDGGTTWKDMGSTLNTTAKTVTLNGIDSFSRWTLGSSDQSLPVQATNFLVKADVGSVMLTWDTQSEVDNAGFNILRQDPGATLFRLISSYTNNDSLKGLGTNSTGRAYQFVDNKVKSGATYNYKIQSVSTDGTTKDVSTLTNIMVDVPKNYALYQNYPNPFNPSTTIRFDLKQTSAVTLEIYNVLGQKVEYWSYGVMGAGRYEKSIAMAQYSSGVYYYRIIAQGNSAQDGSASGGDGQKFVSTKKMMVVK